MEQIKKILFLIVVTLLWYSAFSQEKIENEGAITIDTASSLMPNAGTIEYRSGAFRGFDGANWHKLDEPAYQPPRPSFAYAWLEDSSGIPVNQWTKIHFDKVEFDQNGEFKPYSTIYSEGSFFPIEPGFYQVTARCEYEIFDYQQPELTGDTILDTLILPIQYVSIAVFTGHPDPAQPSPLDDIMYSQGNNLQIETGNFTSIIPLNRNNAPMVSTIVEVLPEQTISIYGFWYKPKAIPGTGYMPFQVAHDPGQPGYSEESPKPETGGPPPSVPDKSKVYITIHKVFP